MLIRVRKTAINSFFLFSTLDYFSDKKLFYLKIRFDATSFDKITKDRAAKFMDKLSAIGGTMGLLTGFSFISGVEILYFVLKFIFSKTRK